MALWAIFASPLIMSNDLESIGRAEREILLNPLVIAVNQDKLGIMGSMVKRTRSIDIFSRPVLPRSGLHKSQALALVNRVEAGGPIPYTLNTTEINLNSDGGYYVTDLFDNNRLITIIRFDRAITLR